MMSSIRQRCEESKLQITAFSVGWCIQREIGTVSLLRNTLVQVALGFSPHPKQLVASNPLIVGRFGVPVPIPDFKAN